MDTHTHLGFTAQGHALSIGFAERMRHTAIIGATGAGKSVMARHMIKQDIARGDGILVIDPHGDLAHAVLSDIGDARKNHVCYLDCAEAVSNSTEHCPLIGVQSCPHPGVAV